jgi:hypothetical protein
MFARKQKFVEDGREAITIDNGAVKGLDSGEGRDPRQHSDVRMGKT